MKNRLVTLSRREIKKSFKRFFSLCVLSFIGVCFFSGIKMAYPDMLESMDKYYDETNMYDFKLLSSLGLTDEDVIEVQKLSSDFKVYGLHFKDVIFNDGENSRIIKLNELSDKINDIHLIEGRLPESKDEIVVEQGITNKTKLKIGDTIEAQLEEDDKDLTNTKFKIVGIVTSPEYLINAKVTQSRGNTNIGNGQISYYGYVLKDVFSMDYYTQICIQDEGADKYLSNTKTKGASKGMASTSRIIPARISKELTKDIKETSKKVFRLLNFSGVCRIDYLIDSKAQKFYVNEPNTIPGSLSFYLWKEDGLKYEDLLDEMIGIAVREYKNKSKKVRSFESNILSGFNGTKGVKGLKK